MTAERRVRIFDFDPGSHPADLDDAVRSALDDEGLELSDWQGARIVAVRIDGVDRVAIPVARIQPRTIVPFRTR